jgi:hypothetical protein
MTELVRMAAVTVKMMFNLFSFAACFCPSFLGLFFALNVQAMNSSEIRTCHYNP